MHMRMHMHTHMHNMRACALQAALEEAGAREAALQIEVAARA